MPEFRYNAKDPQESKQFSSFGEVEHWVDQQVKEWAWITKIAGYPHSSELGHLNAFYQQLEQDLSSLRLSCSQQNESDVHNKLQNLGTRLPYPAKSAFSLAMKNVAAIDPEAAGQALRVASKQMDPNTSAPIGSGCPTILTLFKLGLLPKLDENFRDSREDNQKAWDALRQKHSADWKETAQRINNEIAEVIQERNRQSAALVELLDSTKSRLEDFEREHSDRIALKAPAEHWKTVAASTEFMAKVWGGFFAGILLLGFICVACYVAHVGVNDGDATERLWSLSILALIVGAFSWPLRIIAKLILSNLHLASDARERRVMALVYLSLIKREGGLQEAEKAIVLGSLFRNSATGIVNEDVSQGISADLVSKFMAGSSK